MISSPSRFFADATAETTDSGVNQTNRTVTVTTTTATQAKQRKTAQSTVASERTTQPRLSISHSQGGAPTQASSHLESRLPTVTSTSTAVETRRFSVPSKSTFVVEESLVEIQHLHRQETDHMLNIMKARLKEHEEYRLIREEQFETVLTENEHLRRQVPTLTAQIQLLEIRLSYHDDSRPPDDLDATLTTTLTTLTTTITTVTTQIEQWKNAVVKNKGTITISRTELDKLLSDLSDTSSQMIVLQQQHTVLSKDLESVRQQLRVTVSLQSKKEGTVASLTAEVAQLKDADSANAKRIDDLRQDNEMLRQDVSAASARVAELEALSGELGSSRQELETNATLIAERDRAIASLNADVSRLKESEADKTKQIATLRQDYQRVQRDLAELRERYDGQSKEHKSLVEEKDNTVASLRAEVEKLKSVDVTKTAQLEAERRDREQLQQSVATITSQVTSLQERCTTQSEQIVVLRTDLQSQVSLLAKKEHTLTTLTTELENAKREDSIKGDSIATARQDAEQLRQKLSDAWDQSADLRKRYDTQSTELNNLHHELGRLKIFTKKPDADVSDSDVADYIARALAEKDSQIGVLGQDLAAATSRYNDLQKTHETLSSKVGALNKELASKTSQYEGTVNALTVQVNQLRATDAEKTEKLAASLDQVQDLQLELSTFTAQFTDLQDRYATQTKELTSANSQLQTMTLSIKEKDHDIYILTGERDRQISANTTKAEQITELQRKLSLSTSQLTEIQERFKAQSDDLASIQSQLSSSTSSNEDNGHKVVALTEEVAELKRINGLGDERLATTRKQAEDLKLELTTSRSRVSELQHDNEVLSIDLESVRKQVVALESGADGTKALAAQVEELKRLCAAKVEELTTAGKNIAQLRHDLDDSSSRIAELQKDLTSQIERSQQSEATRAAELVSAREELKQLRDNVSTSSTQIKEYQAQVTELNSKIKHWEQSDATKTTDLTTARAELKQLRDTLSTSSSQLRESQAQLTQLTSQVERSKLSYDAKVKELDAANKKLEQLQRNMDASSSQVIELQRNVDASSSQVTELQHRCETQSAKLKLFYEQLPGMLPGGDKDSTVDSEEWRVIQTKIMTEVKDYATVIQLTAKVDEWLHDDAKRADELAIQLERRNKENEELRNKLVILKEIYIRAPRIKQIFQSETIEIKRCEQECVQTKRRYEEETKTLRAALAESQTQLRGVQRVVATADTYADEMIIQVLKKLNAEVQQSTTLMAEGIAEALQARTTKATKDQISATQKVSKTIGKPLANCLASMKDDDVALYLSIAFQAFFSYYLLQLISSWTTEKGHNDFINDIYEHLQKTGKYLVSNVADVAANRRESGRQRRNRCPDDGEPSRAPTSLPTGWGARTP